MKNTILILWLCLLTYVGFSQNNKGFQWIASHGDYIPFNNEKVEDIHVDGQGNIYVAGIVNDIYVRDSNGNTIPSQRYAPFDSIANHGGGDIWLAKYDPQGNLLWHRYAGGGRDDTYNDMVGDQQGNCYISGRLKYHNTREPYSFNWSPLATNEYGGFIAKVDASGNLVWHQSLGGDTVQGNFYEYNGGLQYLQLHNNGTISAFLSGGGNHPGGFQKLYDRDSIERGYHEVKYDLNGNYLGVKSFPFPQELRIPQIMSIQANENGVLISGNLNQDTVLVDNDTILKSGINNGFVFAFDTSLNLVSTFYGTNYFDQFRDANLFGDTLAVAGHFDLFNSRTVLFDTISHQGSANATQEGAVFLFDVSGTLLGLFPSKSLGSHKSTIGSAYIDQNSVGIGGSFNHKLTYSGGSSYIEAVDNCSSCTNVDLFFALLDRNGSLIAEDVIYSSGFGTDAVFAMHRKDTILYIGGFIGDTVIIPQVDTFITKGDNDAFLAAYNLGVVTSLEEPSGYIKADNGILAYPNPTAGSVTLMGKALNTEAQLYSISGQLVKTYRLVKNAFQQSINLEELDTGVYFLVIIGEEGKQQVKIVKQ
jgi:hypothetical protein